MTTSLEQIEMLRARANVGYAEAQEALENSHGDIVEALIYLEKQNKVKTNQHVCSGDGWTTFKGILKTCRETRLIISKKDRTIINLSLAIVIIGAVFALPLVLAGLLAALLTCHKINIEKTGCHDVRINKTLDNISEAVSSVGKQVVDIIKK